MTMEESYNESNAANTRNSDACAAAAGRQAVACERMADAAEKQAEQFQRIAEAIIAAIREDREQHR